MVELGARTSNSSVLPSPAEPEEMEFPVPAGGVIRLVIPLKNDTELLSIDVRPLLKSHQSSQASLWYIYRSVTPLWSAQAYFEDSHSSLQLYRSYSSPSHSYLQIQKPPTPVQVKQRDPGGTNEPFHDSLFPLR